MGENFFKIKNSRMFSMYTKFASRKIFSYVFGIFHRFCRSHFLSFHHDDYDNYEDDYIRQIDELTIVSEAFVSLFMQLKTAFLTRILHFLFLLF